MISVKYFQKHFEHFDKMAKSLKKKSPYILYL